MTADTACPSSADPACGEGHAFREDARGAGARRLSPERLAQLTALDDARSMAALTRTLALTVVILATALTLDAAWAWLAAVPLVACCQHAIFVLVHDAAHYRLLADRRLNDLCGRALASLAGISMCSYRIVHRLHHNHLYAALDPDVALHGGYPRGRAYLLRKLATDLTGITAYKTYRYFFGAPTRNDDAAGVLRPLDDTAPSLRQAALRDRTGVVLVQLTLPVAACALGGLHGLAAWAVLWLLPAVTVLQAILRVRAILEHGAPMDLAEPTRSARTCLAGPLARFALFPHHVNHHIEHHLYPAVPHYRLPALHAELKALGVLDGADVGPVAKGWRRVYADRQPWP